MRELAATPRGRWLVRSLATVAVLLFSTVVLADVLHIGPTPSWARIWCTPQLQNLERARVSAELEKMPGQQLVIVHYQPNHDFAYDEWVFNGADINDSKVIWARDMGEQNVELLNYFKTRKIWVVEPDRRPVELSPYRSSKPL